MAARYVALGGAVHGVRAGWLHGGMLRELTGAGFVEAGRGPLGRRWAFRGLPRGRPGTGATWRTREVRALWAAQREDPVAVEEDAAGGRVVWLYADRFYAAGAELSAGDVRALVHDRERRARRRLERAHAALAQDAEPPARRREPVPRDVRLAVFERDGGRCVACGSAFELQFDHVIPFSAGGASTAENLQVLCAPCNRRKGASLS
jgi:hypothetical protein